MKFRIVIHAAVLAALVSSAAAVGARAQSTAAGPPSPTPAAVHLVKLTNAAKEPVSAVYVAPAGTLDLSDDLLGKQTAGPGRTVTLKVKDPKGVCVFDLEVLMSSGDDVTKKGVNLCTSDSYTFTP